MWMILFCLYMSHSVVFVMLPSQWGELKSLVLPLLNFKYEIVTGQDCYWIQYL